MPLADIIAPKYGSVPKAVSGPILSCSVGPITQNEINMIRQVMHGIRLDDVISIDSRQVMDAPGNVL